MKRNHKLILELVLALSISSSGVSMGVNASSEISEDMMRNDNRTAYLERYGEYFNIYKYVLEFTYEEFKYSYLFETKEETGSILEKYDLKETDIIELQPNEYYFSIKLGELKNYSIKFSDDCTPKPFKVDLNIYDKKDNTIKYFTFKTTEEALNKVEELNLDKEDYEIFERWGGGEDSAFIEPKQFDGIRTIEYFDEDGRLISSNNVSSDMFAYTEIEGCSQMRFVSDSDELAEKGYTHNNAGNIDSSEIVLGDINSDGKVDLTDLSELSLALLGDKEFTEAQQKSADVDSDGAVKLADLAKFRQFLSKQISSLGE